MKHFYRSRYFLPLVSGLAFVFAIACGPGEPAAPPAEERDIPAPIAATPTVADTVQVAEPQIDEPRYGGIFRWAARGEPAMYDMHQSTTHENSKPQQPQFSTLLQHNPLDGGRTIVADLAYEWDQSEDGTVYTFKLRENVQFHDGTPFTAADVVATYERMINPPEGMVSMRKEFLVDGADVQEIEAVDDHTVRFTLGSPRAVFIPAVASGWNVIYSKDFLERHNNDIRRVPLIPGTGAFKLKDLREGERWVMERNSDYYVEGVPYFDEFHVYVFRDPGPRAAAIYGGRVDMAMQLATNDLAEAERNPDGYGIQYLNVSGAGVTWFNTQRPPFDDARARRAVHLVLDQHELLAIGRQTQYNESVGDWMWPAWMTAGGPWSRGGEELEQVPGWRKPTPEDIAEAKRLMDELGYGEGFRVEILSRGTAEPVHAAIQAAIRRHLDIDAVIRETDRAVYYDEVTGGSFDLTIGWWGTEVDDPSNWWSKIILPGASQNFGNYENPEVTDLMHQINVEQDHNRRVELVRQMQRLLDQEVPFIPYNYHAHQDVYRTYLGGPGLAPKHIVGGYNSDGRRYEHMWFVRDP